MNHTVKIAVTVPARTLRSVEAARRRLGRSRSSIVAEALDAWLRSRSVEERDREYLAGYERIPEPEEGDVAAAIMASWDSWEPARARPRAAKKTTSGRQRRS